MYISITEVFVAAISIVISIITINLSLKNASVKAKILNFSYSKKDHLNKILSIIFIFIIPYVISLLITIIISLLNLTVNYLISITVPIALAMFLSISTAFFVPDLLIPPLKEKLSISRFLYLALVINYALLSSAGWLGVKFIAELKNKNNTSYDIILPLIVAIVLWCFSYGIYLFASKSYQNIIEKDLDNYREKNELTEIPNKDEYFLKELSTLIRTTIYGTAIAINEHQQIRQNERMEIIKKEFLGRLNDFDKIMTITEENNIIRMLNKENYQEPHFQNSNYERWIDFYGYDFDWRNHGYFG